MSDETASTKPAPRQDEVIEDAVLVDDETAPATATDSAAVEVAPVATEPTGPQVVYVHTPPPPRKAGNRGIGSLLALASALVYAVLLAIVTMVIFAITLGGTITLAFLSSANFYVPVLFFLLASVLVVLIVNRAGWAAHVVGSLAVGVIVYFGTIGALLLGQGVVLLTPDEAAALFSGVARNPIVIAAALLAREVALWSGAVIGRRGRKLRARNIDARQAWEREVAETKAEHERVARAV
jgi:hypothetical protein